MWVIKAEGWEAARRGTRRDLQRVSDAMGGYCLTVVVLWVLDNLKRANKNREIQGRIEEKQKLYVSCFTVQRLKIGFLGFLQWGRFMKIYDKGIELFCLMPSKNVDRVFVFKVP